MSGDTARQFVDWVDGSSGSRLMPGYVLILFAEDDTCGMGVCPMSVEWFPTEEDARRYVDSLPEEMQTRFHPHYMLVNRGRVRSA